MKYLTIEYAPSGFNSKRLILNAIMELCAGTQAIAIVQVSPEVHLDDVRAWIDQLPYKVDSIVSNARTNLATLSAFIGEL